MGPGRSGTSFLVRLLADLGMDCGGAENSFNHTIRAGCEWATKDILSKPMWWKKAPKVLKSPWFSFSLGKWIGEGMDVEHVFIPVRESCGIARSRTMTGLKWAGKNQKDDQILAEQAIGSSISICVANDIPYSLLHFPEYVRCPVFLRDEFRKVPSLKHITLNQICEKFWPLANYHEELTYVESVRRRVMSNQGSPETDP